MLKFFLINYSLLGLFAANNHKTTPLDLRDMLNMIGIGVFKLIAVKQNFQKWL